MKKVLLIIGIGLLLTALSSCKKDKSAEEISNNTPVEGSLSGVFSVGNGKQVRFSKGNLQYQASTDTWRFAENQYDCIGNANSNVSMFYQGWIDLFGWGASGYNDIKPWLIDYDMEATSFTGTRYDWGINNAISNGGNQSGLWHVLTIEQWNYLVNERSGSRFAKATVADVRGLLLLPDNWSESTYTLNAVNDAEGGYASNTISSTDFIDVLEHNGVVFLPSAGLREGNNVNYVNGFGRYWSSSYVEKARSLFFHESDVRPEGADYHSGFSVRLVCDAN